MKKLLILALGLCMALTFPSCSDDGVETTEPPIEGNEEGSEQPEVTNDSILIVYFSHSQNTATMAGYIQEYTGGATFEIVPEVPYPDDYEATVAIADQERNTNARPEIRNPLENLDQYSIVFIGSPIWYYAPPMIIRTFYETYREGLTGKILVPFCTHAGSGVSSSTSLAREYFPNATILDAFGVSGSNIRNESARTDVESWLERINIPRHEE